MIPALIQRRLPMVHEICRSCRVKTLFLFGSAASPTFQAQSDIDLLVDFEVGLDPETYTACYFRLEEKLEELLNRTIDLTTERSVRSPYFRMELDRTKVFLYGAEQVAHG